MLEAVRSNKRISQIILAVIIVPFAFFGMDAFFDGSMNRASVASVGGLDIGPREFEQALRERQEQIQQARGGQYDRALFESEAFRMSVLESLINQKTLALHAAKNRMVISQQQLQELIASLPVFQENGQFSLDRYERLVRAQNMTPAVFEAQLAQDLRIQQITAAVGESAIGGTLPARRLLLAQLEEREFRELQFKAAPLKEGVTLAENAARDYYEAHPARFERPARLRAEYLVFDQKSLHSRVEVSDDQVQQFYQANQDRYGQPEERRARHILVQAAADAADDVIEEARRKAQEILDRVRSDPARFEEIARAESQDPGSAASGGDLGFFGPGAMVQAFEDAVYALSPGQVSDLVRTDFGFHVIELTEIRPPTIRPLDEVREEIVEELKRQEASRLFAMNAEKFANAVYEQPDSLQPAAEMLGLEIRTSDWIFRNGGKIDGYGDEKLIGALFSEEVREAGENTEAVEVERGVLVAARVAEYEAARVLPFEEVQPAIEEQLRSEEAARLARERGERTLEALASGQGTEGGWTEKRKVQRSVPTLPPAAMQAIFSASTANLPARVGVVMPQGDYVIYEILNVERPELTDDDPRLQAVAQQYSQWMADSELRAYISALRERYKVKVSASALRTESQ